MSMRIFNKCFLWEGKTKNWARKEDFYNNIRKYPIFLEKFQMEGKYVGLCGEMGH